jgi:drug/metabolite transporter (DMT)-like permease
MVAALAAVGAAGAYALASVLQHRAAAAEPAALSLRLRLLTRLAVRPLWAAGVSADIGGYGLQFVALGVGSLAVVQPLLVSGLLLALPLSARFEHRRVTQAEWAAATALVTGLALFLVVARPADGRSSASAATWTAVTLLTLGPAALLVSVGQARLGRARARLFAAAAGLVYGFTAALTKASAHLLSRGAGHIVGAWQPYALVACGGIGMLLAQSAFQAAPLDASLPVITVIDPLVSVVIGALGFGEALTTSGAAVTFELAAVALVVAGVVRLCRDAAVPVVAPA